MQVEALIVIRRLIASDAEPNESSSQEDFISCSGKWNIMTKFRISMDEELLAWSGPGLPTCKI